MLQIVSTLVRHALTLVAGGLIADGTLTDSDVQIVSGAVTTVAVVIWSIIEKKYFTKAK